MDEPNEIIHQSMRLKIMSALNAQPDGALLDFTGLKAIVRATDGNLGAHLATLETAGYVRIEKDFLGKKARTRIAVTRDGRRAFDLHVAYLRDMLGGSKLS
jgi:DNA-binding transcriptional ArsR family regulator